MPKKSQTAETEQVKKSALQLEMEKIEKDYGKGTIITNATTIPNNGVISTGSLGLDRATGIWGLPRGKVVEIMGWESCLDKDSYVKFLVIDPATGKVQDCKGGTIENLYKRYHRLPPLHYNHERTDNSEYYVVSINEDNRIIRNKIVDVVFTGERDCFRIGTKEGFCITATGEHKFFIGTRYIELKDLSEGDIVYIHNNTPFQGRNKCRRHQQEHVKYYYKGKQRIINGYPYYRVDTHRLVYEANLNGMNLDQYKEFLNSGITTLPKGWNTIPEGMHIHHEDEDARNNDISNLVLIDPSAHGRLHATERHNNLRFIAVPTKITSKVHVGKKLTYDIKCLYPYNNYIAEGFVVHNSGKSTIVQQTIGNAQAMGLRALYIDGENSFDATYAKALGVDVDNLLIEQLDEGGGERCYNVAERLIKTRELGIVVIDSQTSLLPKKVLEGEVGDSALGLHARMMSQCVPKLVNAAQYGNCLVIFVSQFREKIGVMFGSPET